MNNISTLSLITDIAEKDVANFFIDMIKIQ